MFEPNSLRCAPRHSSRMGVLVCDISRQLDQRSLLGDIVRDERKVEYRVNVDHCALCRPRRRRSPSINAMHVSNRKTPVVCFVHALRLLPRPKSLRLLPRAEASTGAARGIGLGSIRESLFLFPLSLRGREARRPLDDSQLSRKFRLARSSDGQAP